MRGVCSWNRHEVRLVPNMFNIEWFRWYYIKLVSDTLWGVRNASVFCPTRASLVMDAIVLLFGCSPGRTHVGIWSEIVASCFLQLWPFTSCKSVSHLISGMITPSITSYNWFQGFSRAVWVSIVAVSFMMILSAEIVVGHANCFWEFVQPFQLSAGDNP
jgi:hypothetical protein